MKVKELEVLYIADFAYLQKIVIIFLFGWTG